MVTYVYFNPEVFKKYIIKLTCEKFITIGVYDFEKKKNVTSYFCLTKKCIELKLNLHIEYYNVYLGFQEVITIIVPVVILLIMDACLKKNGGCC